ncbi:nucleotidyltransferase family protein [soil metagenome]
METAAQTKQDVLDRLSQNQSDISALGVKKMGLFGSFVREGQEPGSDVDLLVAFEPNKKTFDNFMKLSFLLEDLLRREVELVTVESLRSHIGPRILEEAEYVFSST